MIKASTPGSYTFILPATKDVPRRFLHPKKRTVGVRIPEHAVVQDLITELGEPLLSSTSPAWLVSALVRSATDTGRVPAQQTDVDQAPRQPAAGSLLLNPQAPAKPQVKSQAGVHLFLPLWTFWRPWRTPVTRFGGCWRWRTTGGATEPIMPTAPRHATVAQGGDRHRPTECPSHDAGI